MVLVIIQEISKALNEDISGITASTQLYCCCSIYRYKPIQVRAAMNMAAAAMQLLVSRYLDAFMNKYQTIC